MKFKLLVKLATLILGHTFYEDKPRADMCLPLWLLGFGLILYIAAVFAAVYAVIMLSIGALIISIAAIFLGTAAMLCWRNQTINIISEEEFEYTTFVGNKKRYSFKNITGLKKNQDSLTIFVGREKIHIEACAYMSERLLKRLDNIFLDEAVDFGLDTEEEQEDQDSFDGNLNK